MPSINQQPERGKQESQIGDDELRSLLMLGNVDALSVLWDSYAQTLFRLLLSILQTSTDAEDVLQDVFIKIAHKRIDIAQTGNIGAYIYRLTRNAGIDAFNKRKKSRQKSQSIAALLQCKSPEVTPTENDGLQQRVNQAIASLPEKQRNIIILKIYDNKTFAQISEILDISANTCASRYRYATEKLRSQLQGVWP